MTDDDRPDDTEQETPTVDLPNTPDDATTPQQIIDSAVDRKGAEWVRENFEQHVAPLKRLGYNISRDDVELPERHD